MKNIALIVAIVLGIVAAIGVRMWLKRQKASVVEQLKPVPVVVAKVSIKKGEKLTPDKVATQRRPIESLSQGTITQSKVDMYYGRTVWRDVDRGTELQANFFIEPLTVPASRGLAEGERALTINVDATSGVAGLLRPTDRVDILATMTVDQNPQQPRADQMKTTMVLSDVTILAVDNRMSAMAGAADRFSRGKYTTVTLAVTPLEAQVLTFLRNRAQLTLTLRPRLETGQTREAQDVDMRNVLSLAEQANQARQKRLTERREPAQISLEDEE